MGLIGILTRSTEVPKLYSVHTLRSVEYWDRLCRQCVIPLGKSSQVQREDVCSRQSLLLATLAIGCSPVIRGSDKFEGSHLTYLNQR